MGGERGSLESSLILPNEITSMNSVDQSEVSKSANQKKYNLAHEIDVFLPFHRHNFILSLKQIYEKGLRNGFYYF